MTIQTNQDVQVALNEMQYYGPTGTPGRTDGVIDADTQGAISQFQMARFPSDSSKWTGVADAATKAAMDQALASAGLPAVGATPANPAVSQASVLPSIPTQIGGISIGWWAAGAVVLALGAAAMMQPPGR